MILLTKYTPYYKRLLKLAMTYIYNHNKKVEVISK